jgi:hypothetical protein
MIVHFSALYESIVRHCGTIDFRQLECLDNTKAMVRNQYRNALATEVTVSRFEIKIGIIFQLISGVEIIFPSL